MCDHRGSEGSGTSDLPRRAALLFRIALNSDVYNKQPASQGGREGTPRVKTRALHCYCVSVACQHQEAANRGLNLRLSGDFPVAERIPAVTKTLRCLLVNFDPEQNWSYREILVNVPQHSGGPTVLVNTERAAFAPPPVRVLRVQSLSQRKAKNNFIKKKIGYKVHCHGKKLQCVPIQPFPTSENDQGRLSKNVQCDTLLPSKC